MIRIDICSDLHVDAHKYTEKIWYQDTPSRSEDGSPILFDFNAYRNPGSECIVIAGDISDSLDDVEACLRSAASVYDLVVYVDGNHEHQDKTYVSDTMDALNDLKQSIPNLVYLDGEHSPRYDYKGVAFIGGNGWYDWRVYEDRGISWTTALDFWDTRFPDRTLNFGEYIFPNRLAWAQYEKIREAYEQAAADPSISRIVMVTHTTPHAMALEWRNDLAWDEGSPSFCNSEFQQILGDPSPKLKLWVYGHTHFKQQWTLNGVKLINNSYGYPRQVSSNSWAMAVIEV